MILHFFFLTFSCKSNLDCSKDCKILEAGNLLVWFNEVFLDVFLGNRRK